MLRTSVYIPLLFIGLAVGCGSQPERVPVTGEVMLDGKSIGNCTLVFQSIASAGSAGTAVSASAAVSDGKFELAKSNGLFAGEYGVVFTEIQPDLDDYEAARRAGSKNALTRKFIPTRYTTANELRVKIAANMQPLSLKLKSR